MRLVDVVFRRWRVEGSKCDLLYDRVARYRAGRRASASHVGKGTRTTSTKHEVGRGEAIDEDGPCHVLVSCLVDKYRRRTKPSARFLQSCILVADVYARE